MMRRHRHTVMDGRVVSFALGFQKQSHCELYDATGPFEVSASRNAVVVHRAELTTPDEADQFYKATFLAIHEMLALKRCDGRPSDSDDGTPREVPDDESQRATPKAYLRAVK